MKSLSCFSCLRLCGTISFCFCACLFLTAQAPPGPQERILRASKTDVESALRDLRSATSGSLPVLDGFVVPGDQHLDRYQRAFYQCTTKVTAVTPASSQVRVSAKITAWYNDPVTSRSGYRVLPSNGRLETDLLDRLDEATQQKTAVATLSAHPAPSAQNTPQFTLPYSVVSAAPNSPAPGSPAPAAGPSAISSPAPRRTANATALTERRIQDLRRQIADLEEIARNQTRPDDLAAVKVSGTPVLEQPVEGAKALFLADAHDEFQVLGTSGEWVHLRISGLSRGWMKRSDLELPGLASPAADAVQEEPFRQTQVETSVFPGDWAPLRGKKVRIIWVQPNGSSTDASHSKLDFTKSLFRKTFSELSQTTPDVAGVVILFDSQDGGMAAVTLAALQQWNAGHLSENAFWKQCWLDPAEAFK